MLNPKLTALIPDQPFQEFTLVGSLETPLVQRLYSRTVRGYQGAGRRVWITPHGLLDVGIERVHCSFDSEQIVEFVRPDIPTLAEMSRYNLSVTTSPAGLTSAEWHSNGMSFVTSMKSSGPFIIEAAVVTTESANSDQEAAKTAARIVEETSTRIVDPNHRDGACLGRWANILWSIAYQMPIIAIFIFIPGMITVALMPKPFFLASIALGAIVATYVCSKWSASIVRNRRHALWSRACEQGDQDGTIRRALASIGHPLAPPEPPTNNR